MALRNTLIACAAIVGGGAIAGVAMQPHAYGPPGVEPASDLVDTRSQPSAPPTQPPAGGGDQTISLSQLTQADRTLPHMTVESTNGQRIGEVVGIVKNELHIGEQLALWIIPKARTKSKREHRMPP